jgi:hypothetical protein
LVQASKIGFNGISDIINTDCQGTPKLSWFIIVSLWNCHNLRRYPSWKQTQKKNGDDHLDRLGVSEIRVSSKMVSEILGLWYLEPRPGSSV